MNLIFALIFVFIQASLVFGHGYMLSPVNRASRWRIDPENSNITRNYQDNQYFCGGFATQHELNEGLCGPCGDDWRDEIPRSNENGGVYGNGVVVATYTAGSIIETTVILTANHLGNISFQLCKLEDPDVPDTEECFKPLQLVDGSSSQPIDIDDYNVTSYVQLPDRFICERCVLRWHYSTGNNWGICEDGVPRVGCGAQETFRSCADIEIMP